MDFPQRLIDLGLADKNQVRMLVSQLLQSLSDILGGNSVFSHFVERTKSDSMDSMECQLKLVAEKAVLTNAFIVLGLLAIEHASWTNEEIVQQASNLRGRVDMSASRWYVPGQGIRFVEGDNTFLIKKHTAEVLVAILAIAASDDQAPVTEMLGTVEREREPEFGYIRAPGAGQFGHVLGLLLPERSGLDSHPIIDLRMNYRENIVQAFRHFLKQSIDRGYTHRLGRNPTFGPDRDIPDPDGPGRKEIQCYLLFSQDPLEICSFDMTPDNACFNPDVSGFPVEPPDCGSPGFFMPVALYDFLLISDDEGNPRSEVDLSIRLLNSLGAIHAGGYVDSLIWEGRMEPPSFVGHSYSLNIALSELPILKYLGQDPAQTLDRVPAVQRVMDKLYIR